MKLIDTHAHIYADSFNTDRITILQNARSQGVEKIFMPNIDLESVEGMFQLANEHPDLCYPMMGLHPCSVDADWEKVLEELLGWFNKRKFIAVGEIGIDLYWDKTTLQIQQKVFRTQVEFAIEKNLPIAIHSRSATPEIIAILADYKSENLNGVFHCFSEYFEFIDTINDMGFYFGIGGVLTYKKSGLAEVINQIPMDKIILETDAPYLSPVPYRGKRNEPAYIWHVANKMAEITGKSIEEIGEITSENALKLFQLSN